MKIVIDGNLIDLEMITHIDSRYSELDENGKVILIIADFSIHLVGKERIDIGRSVSIDSFATSYESNPIFPILKMTKEYDHNAFEKAQEEALLKVQTMFDNLMELWKGTDLKFKDLTIK